ncbi:hypothetical protein CSB20_03735, partial [bacterium DOLZORAL124_64_63]
GLVGKHLLGIREGGLRVNDFRVRAFEGMDLYGVSLTLPSASGGMTLVSADTVRVDFRLGEVLDVVPGVRRLEVKNPEIYSRAGTDTTLATPDQEREFPRLAIEHLLVREASLEFWGRDGRLQEHVSRLDFQGAIRSDKDLEMTLRGVDVDWDTHQCRLEGLRGRLRIDQEMVATEEVYGFFNGHPALVSGQRGWDETLDLRVQADSVSIAEVEDLIDMTIGFKARGKLDATFVTEGESLVYEGVFHGDLEGFQMRDLRGRAEITEEEVRLTEARGEVNGATFTGVGRFDLTDPRNVHFVLEGDVAEVDMAKGLVPGEENLPVTNGHGRLRIEHTDVPQWTRVTGRLQDGHIEIAPFDTCVVDVEAWEDSLRFNSVDLQYRDLRAMLDGRSDAQRVFHGNISLESVNIATLPESWGWPALKGRAYGRGHLEGPLEDLAFDGWVSVYDFRLGALAARYGEAALSMGDVLEDVAITGGVEGEGFEVGGVSMGRFQLRGAVDEHRAQVDSFRADLGDTSVALSFRGDFTDSLSSFEVPSFHVDLEGTRWSLTDTLRFALGPGIFRLPEAELASDQGLILCGGHYDAQSNTVGRMVLEDFDLGLLNPFVVTRTPLRGRVTADVGLSGPAQDPLVIINGRLEDADFPLARIDSLGLEASLSGGTVEIQDMRLLSEYGEVRAAGLISHPGRGVADFWPGAELDLDMNVPDGDWLFLEQFQLPALERLAGRFQGDIVVGGTTDDPEIVGNLRSAPFHVHWLHLDELEGRVRATRDQLVLADLKGRKDSLELTGRIEVPLELDLLSEPVTPLDGPFFMQLGIPPDSDLEPMSRATNGFITSEGRGRASVIVSGPLDHPSYQGHVEIRDAGFVLPQQEEIYHDASCKGVFHGDELIITDIEGREGLRGRYTGQGRVVFNGLELESFDVTLDLDRFLVASIPDLRAVVSGRNCKLSSVFVGPDSVMVPKFTGTLDVDKARYTGDFKEQPAANDPLQATVAPDWLAELTLHAAPRTVRILNREMELYLGGDADLSRTEAGMNLRGSLDVNSGRLVVFNNNFSIKRGRLDFSRELGFDPRMDIDAETRYRLRSSYSSNSIIEHIGVHVDGTINRPVISFSSERGYSREAIQRMLLGLEPQATPEGDRARLANTSITAGFNVLEREIARELDIFDTFEIDQIQRRRETGESGLDPLIGVGKYIGSDLYLKYAQGIRQDDRDFLVEYQINDHLLLQSEVRRRIDENQGQPTYNLDLKYRFEY